MSVVTLILKLVLAFNAFASVHIHMVDEPDLQPPRITCASGTQCH